eukprot:1158940-Pelagomonas_calceolata.AAC.5
MVISKDTSYVSPKESRTCEGMRVGATTLGYTFHTVPSKMVRPQRTNGAVKSRLINESKIACRLSIKPLRVPERLSNPGALASLALTTPVH